MLSLMHLTHIPLMSSVMTRLKMSPSSPEHEHVSVTITKTHLESWMHHFKLKRTARVLAEDMTELGLLLAPLTDRNLDATRAICCQHTLSKEFTLTSV